MHFLALPRCGSRADVGFLIDSSASLFRNYAKEKEFVQSFAKKLKISEIGNHAGAMLFSSTPELSIKFSDHSNVEGFIKAVEELPLLGGTTRIDLALQKAFDEVFTLKNGMRASASKLLLVLTDGKQTEDGEYMPLYEAALPFHEAGIKIIAIGIGSQVDKDQLSKLVTEPKDLYLAKDFEELVSQEFIKNITFDSCATPGLYCGTFYGYTLAVLVDGVKKLILFYKHNINLGFHN